MGYRKTNIHAVRTSGEKFISSLHCVAKKEKSKRVPELGGRELTDLSPDVVTAYIMADPFQIKVESKPDEMKINQRSRRDRAERGRRSGGVDANGMPIAPGDGLEEGEEVDMDENVHCVNGYCIDRKYNKLELPSAGKTHVRMNLEVSLRNKKITATF